MVGLVIKCQKGIVKFLDSYSRISTLNPYLDFETYLAGTQLFP